MTKLRTIEEEEPEQESAHERQRCPECSGDIISKAGGTEHVCEDCGLVVTEQPIDPGPEWRAFNSQERNEKSRVGAPATKLIHDQGLSTKISQQDRDARGKLLSARKRQELSRLRTWDERFRTQGSDERNLQHALGEVRRMASALGLPEPTQEIASTIYRRALENDMLPGRSIEGMATAALYAAARLDGIARSIDEVQSVSRVDGIEIKRTYRYLTRELGLEIPPTNPAEFIGRFASDLGCNDETERFARSLIDAATEAGIHSGKHPVGIAASALYGAGKLTGAELTQEEISTVTDISEVTIRNRYRELLEVYDEAEGNGDHR